MASSRSRDWRLRLSGAIGASRSKVKSSGCARVWRGVCVGTCIGAGHATTPRPTPRNIFTNVLEERVRPHCVLLLRVSEEPHVGKTVYEENDRVHPAPIVRRSV